MLPLLIAGVVSAFASPTSAQLLGPTPYLGFADSPFNGLAFSYFHLANMESGSLGVPGVTASTGAVFGPGGFSDSVDEDDGSIDGSGTDGRSYFASSGPTGVTFTFDQSILGQLPTHVGVVWTDGENVIRFEAFDVNGVSLGQVEASSADASIIGTTAEDRFFGIVHPPGIKSIRLRCGLPNVGGGLELDHLQFGVGGDLSAGSASWGAVKATYR